MKDTRLQKLYQTRNILNLIVSICNCLVIILYLIGPYRYLAALWLPTTIVCATTAIKDYKEYKNFTTEP